MAKAEQLRCEAEKVRAGVNEEIAQKISVYKDQLNQEYENKITALHQELNRRCFMPVYITTVFSVGMLIVWLVTSFDLLCKIPNAFILIINRHNRLIGHLASVFQALKNIVPSSWGVWRLFIPFIIMSLITSIIIGVLFYSVRRIIRMHRDQWQHYAEDETTFIKLGMTCTICILSVIYSLVISSAYADIDFIMLSVFFSTIGNVIYHRISDHSSF